MMTGGDWPEKFIYVTSATAGAAVNVAPIAKAGIDRIVEIHVFVGMGSATDRADAEIPYENLCATVEVLAKAAAVRPPPVVAHQGDVHDLAHWNEKFVTIRERNAPDVPLVLNITPGTKAMSLGAALARGPKDWLLQVPFNLVAELYPAEGQPFQAPPRAELCLDHYLTAYGFVETATKQRMAIESTFLGKQNVAIAIHDFLTTRHNGVAAQLNRDGHTIFFKKSASAGRVVRVDDDLGAPPDRRPDEVAELEERDAALALLLGSAKERSVGRVRDEAGSASLMMVGDARVNDPVAVQVIHQARMDRFSGGVSNGGLFMKEVVVCDGRTSIQVDIVVREGAASKRLDGDPRGRGGAPQGGRRAFLTRRA